jgi:sporulation protein YlmC with PRC-barrel domain
MKMNYHNFTKKIFHIHTILGVCAFLIIYLVTLPVASAAKNPFGYKEPNLQYRLMGKIVNVQGDNFLVRKDSGERVRIQITENTNMVCKDMPRNSNQSAAGNVDFKPDQPTTKGFRIGDCPPGPGEYIKAETTDKGTVTFLRTVESWSRNSADQTERLGLPQKYSVDGHAVFPVVRQGLSQQMLSGYEVLTADGNKLGNLRKIIIDTKTGNIVYGVIKLDQEAIQTKGMEVSGGSLMPLPWSAFQTTAKAGVMQLDVTTQQLANIPGYGKDVDVGDIRGYWELSDPNLPTQEGKGLPIPHYRGADRVDKFELERARQQYQMAREHFTNLDTVYQDDIEELERARDQFEEAFLQYSREGGEKTIQQKLQSQIFR